MFRIPRNLTARPLKTRLLNTRLLNTRLLAALAAIGSAMLATVPAHAQSEVQFLSEQNSHRVAVTLHQSAVSFCQIEMMSLFTGREIGFSLIVTEYGRLSLTLGGKASPAIKGAAGDGTGLAVFRITRFANGQDETSTLILDVKPSGALFIATGDIRPEDASTLLAGTGWDITTLDGTRLGVITPPEDATTAAKLQYAICRESL